MAKVAINQTNFSAGEFSPRVLGRTDLDRYVNGAKEITNAYPVLHGGVKRRPGTDYVAAAKSAAAKSRLLPFIISRDESFFVELGNLVARVYEADGTYVTELVTPYTTAQLWDVDFAQSGNVVIFSHPSHALQRMRLIDGLSWVWDAAPISVPPLTKSVEYPDTAGVVITLGSAAVGATTATASASYWTEAYIGRTIEYQGGLATVTGYTSGTVLQVTVSIAFPGTVLGATASVSGELSAVAKVDRLTEGGSYAVVYIAPTKDATLTLSSTSGAITITASASTFVVGDIGKVIYADDGAATITGYTSGTLVNANVTATFGTGTYYARQWGITRPALTGYDTGRYIKVNGGLYRIDSLLSSTSFSSTVITPATETTAAVQESWQYLMTSWDATQGYPRSVTFHEQRLIAGGSDAHPQTIWGSVTGAPLDFTPGTADDDGFSFDIASDDTSRISFVSSARTLVIHTYSGEFSAQGGVEKPITPTNIRIRQESAHGTDNVRPVMLGRESVFAQRSGRKVRSMGYRYDFDGYSSPDISIRADHLTRDSEIVQMAWQQEPDSLLWCIRDDGALLSCTFDRDTDTVAWAKHYTDGAFESVVTVPDGNDENVYVIVRRTVNGSTVRYIERFNSTFTPAIGAVPTGYPPLAYQAVYGGTVDCGEIFSNAGGATVFNVAHLIGKEVDIVADGSVMPRQTVPASGNITLTRTAYQVLIGLPFTSRVKLMTPEIGTSFGSAQASAMRTAEITIRFLETIGAKVYDGDGNSVGQLSFKGFGVDVLDESPQLFTGLKRIEKLGWERGRDELEIVQEQPLPMHVLSVIRKITVNEG